MPERFRTIKVFKEDDKENVLFTIDAMIHEIKNRKTYANK